MVWRDAGGGPTVVEAATGRPAILTAEQIRAAAARLLPDAPLQRMILLRSPDAYWYSHHQTRVLPVWRVEFGDPAATWLHIDPGTGQLLGQSGRRGRARRWLFNAAHSLDFAWLLQHRLAWDFVLWLLSGAGLLVAATGVVIGWRRLRS